MQARVSSISSLIMDPDLAAASHESEAISTASTVSGVDTPTNTTVIDDENDRPCACHVSATPYPGGSYTIRSRSDGRVIMLLNGRVFLSAPPFRSQNGQGWDLRTCGGMVWDCVETDGFLGFRNPVSGTTLGYRAKDRYLHAEVKHHKGHEFFVARKRIDGGFELWMMESGWKMEAVGLDNEDDIMPRRNGTQMVVWEFDEVK